jgi:hypothetical protein
VDESKSSRENWEDDIGDKMERERSALMQSYVVAGYSNVPVLAPTTGNKK